MMYWIFAYLACLDCNLANQQEYVSLNLHTISQKTPSEKGTDLKTRKFGYLLHHNLLQ